MMNEIEQFIMKFKSLNPTVTEDLFLYGDCYYFTVILRERFKDIQNITVKYLVIDNHFVTEINGRIYDVRGDVTEIVDKKQLIVWDELRDTDELLYKRIVRDCINF